ncbi:MAG TPA: DUF1351 domain-containing protein [Candidatus Saccharimonadales bacterium]|nr:DUF1351 domain-containing protein [Candidatus Saccharimonadales bacterium]
MDQNEIVFPESEITVQPGNIVFNSYLAIKEQAEVLAEKIKTVEVTEENVKESKKLLAAINKKVKELEDGRISVKKMLLEPYQNFEDQVKEIVTIVKDADEVVRLQVKHLEEAERKEKHGILEGLFNNRIIHYPFKNLFSFQDFMKPKHLNKAVSIRAVEEEMVYFLERLNSDLKAIEGMVDSEQVLTAYKELKDLGAAITLVAENKQKQQAVVDAQALKQPTEDKIAYLVTVKCTTLKELKLLEYELNEQGFEFTVDKIF